MKLGGGRAKGSSFERKVAKEVVTAFARFGITSKDCYRTPMSGGHIFAKQSDPGDLVISDRLRKYFPMHVEAKHWRRIELWPLWEPEIKQLDAWKFKGWLKQVTDASRGTPLRPLLVFKGNGNMPVMCAWPLWSLDKNVKKPEHRLRFIYAGKPWYVSLFADLLRVMVAASCPKSK